MVRRERRRYNPVASQDEDWDEETAVRTGDALPNESTLSLATTTTTTTTTLDEEETSTIATDHNEDDDDDWENNKESIRICVLDFAQSRFYVEASPTWTVQRFKEEGYKVHRVVPSRQRLIFRGKLLADEGQQTLAHYGITENDVIIHLFPKPRVVITNNDAANAGDRESAGTNSNEEVNPNALGDSTVGARIPTIVMDASEAERRGEILVLGSPDFMESQNNVKLFSFMLLIISSIELLNLIGIAMGVPQDEVDSGLALPNSSNQYSDEYEYGSSNGYHDEFNNQEYYSSMQMDPYGTRNSTSMMEDDPVAALYAKWGWPQSVDTVVSLLGVYVAILGLQASTHHTVRLARSYLWGLYAAGITWLLYNFFFTVAIEERVAERDQEIHRDDPSYVPSSKTTTGSSPGVDVYNQAFQVMILPTMVWFMCWIRAWHFHKLLQQAEEEAAERMQSQLDLQRDDTEDEAALMRGNHSLPGSPPRPSNHDPSSSLSDSTIPARHFRNNEEGSQEATMSIRATTNTVQDEELALGNPNAVFT